jgi:predicted nucleotidyltransferase
MDQIKEIIKKKTDTALTSISNLTGMERAFLFGSQVDGTADQWSDIDMAVFVEGAEKWDIHKRARLIARIQKEAGDDIEVHFIPAKALRENDKAGFAAWVLTHGIEISL